VATVTATSHDDPGLSPATLYGYTVSAFDFKAHESPTAAASVQTPDATPAGFGASALPFPNPARAGQDPHPAVVVALHGPPGNIDIRQRRRSGCTGRGSAGSPRGFVNGAPYHDYLWDRRKGRRGLPPRCPRSKGRRVVPRHGPFHGDPLKRLALSLVIVGVGTGPRAEAPGAAFLAIDPSVRAQALGGAQALLAGAESLGHNPAGLALLPVSAEAVATYGALDEGVSYGHAAFAPPGRRPRRGVRFGGHRFCSWTGETPPTAWGKPVGGSTDAGDIALSAGVGGRLVPNVFWGIAGRGGAFDPGRGLVRFGLGR
jgi:hypothetical protein